MNNVAQLPAPSARPIIMIEVRIAQQRFFLDLESAGVLHQALGESLNAISNSEQNCETVSTTDTG